MEKPSQKEIGLANQAATNGTCDCAIWQSKFVSVLQTFGGKFALQSTFTYLALGELFTFPFHLLLIPNSHSPLSQAWHSLTPLPDYPQ